MTSKNLVVIQDALWSRMKKHGQFTKKDSLALRAIEKEALWQKGKDGE